MGKARSYRHSLMVILAAGTALGASGCGVRQFNEKLRTLTKNDVPGGTGGAGGGGSSLIQGFGPFWASGQKGDIGMAPPPGGCNTATNRPCARGRFSVGLPAQMDSNTNLTQGHTTVAGAGRSLALSSARTDGPSKVEQRDLHLMRRASKGKLATPGVPGSGSGRLGQDPPNTQDEECFDATGVIPCPP